MNKVGECEEEEVDGEDGLRSHKDTRQPHYIHRDDGSAALFLHNSRKDELTRLNFGRSIVILIFYSTSGGGGAVLALSPADAASASLLFR